MESESGINTLDLSGLVCPMPIIKLKKYLSQNSKSNLTVWLTITDKGGLKDIPAFCQQQSLMCDLIENNEKIVFRIARP